MPSLLKLLRSLSPIALMLIAFAAAGQIVPMLDPAVPANASDPHSSRSAGPPGDNEPVASIAGWSLHDESDKKTVTNDSEVVLEPNHPEIILFFGSTSPPDAPIEYRYRLSDYDLGWTVTRGQLAHYRRLSPGHYRFEVQAHALNHPWTSPA